MKHTSNSSDRSARKSASQSPLMFEISRGRTDSPLRPINRDRFLIGSGERCDLRLGGQDVPAVHSVVHIDGDQIWLEALAESPEVRVNGRLTRSAALEPGDALEIGSFCLTLHRTSSVQPVPAPRIHGARVSEILTEEESADLLDIEDLSARELVDLIEQEEALIEEFESRRQMGAQALLDVLNQRFGPDVSDDSQTVDATPDTRQLLHELQMAIISLNEFAQDFEQRTDRLSQRDTHRAANSLLDFQKQIVSRLDGVLGKIACIDEADRRRMPRRDVA